MQNIDSDNLRPRSFANFIGQDKVKHNLQVFIQSANARAETLDHVLLYGAPGLGKTTLAYIIANQLDVNFIQTSAPAIERSGDLAAILTHLQHRDVLFIDEIHRLRRPVEEILYSAMEDFKMDIILGKGPNARSFRMDIEPFTLVAATTKPGLIAPPLRDRFGIPAKLDYYSAENLAQIVIQSADRLNIPIESQAALTIAARARGTPRIANRILKRVRDFANTSITNSVALHALNCLDIDFKGLDTTDRRILQLLASVGKPIGLKSIAAATNESIDTITDICEPYLLQLGFIARSDRGRFITNAGHNHLQSVQELPQQM